MLPGIRYGYHFVSIVSIYSSIAQYAAVALAADGTAVAVFVAGRSADEGDIDMSFAGFNGSYAAAWLRMMARPFSLPLLIAWPILPRTPED